MTKFFGCRIFRKIMGQKLISGFFGWLVPWESSDGEETLLRCHNRLFFLNYASGLADLCITNHFSYDPNIYFISGFFWDDFLASRQITGRSGRKVTEKGS